MYAEHPGPDGFPLEFYQKLSPTLSPLLKAVFDDSLDSSTPCQASVSLLLKKRQGSSEFVLLPSDKTLLALRLEPILSTIS